MSELFSLVFEFFKTGLFAIGGGMATIPFLYDIADVPMYTVNKTGDYSVAPGEIVTIQNDLDNYFPFNAIKEVVDDEGNVFVSFPRFWLKWGTDAQGNLDSVSISDKQVDSDYFIPDAFLDPMSLSTGVPTYLESFLMGKYQGTGSSTKIFSKTQETLASMTRSASRTASRAYGNAENAYKGYQLCDLSMWYCYVLLSCIYMRTKAPQDVLYVPWSGRVTVTGNTDIVSTLSGFVSYQQPGGNGVKLLGVENTCFNNKSFVDGTYIENNKLYVQRYPQQFADSTENAHYVQDIPTYTHGNNTLKFMRPLSDPNVRSYLHAAEVTNESDSYYAGMLEYSAGKQHLVVGSFSAVNTQSFWGQLTVTLDTTGLICMRLAKKPIQ